MNRAHRRPKDPHESAVCRLMGQHRFHNRSHSDRFQCPICFREGRFNLNWLGNQKVVVCVGKRFERRERHPGDRQIQRSLL